MLYRYKLATHASLGNTKILEKASGLKLYLRFFFFFAQLFAPRIARTFPIRWDATYPRDIFNDERTTGQCNALLADVNRLASETYMLSSSVFVSEGFFFLILSSPPSIGQMTGCCQLSAAYRSDITYRLDIPNERRKRNRIDSNWAGRLIPPIQPPCINPTSHLPT